MNNNKKGYSIIIIIVLIGFMILLTTGVFRLVLNEMKDNNSIGNYAKAYIGAESAQELALLQIKEKGYGFNENLEEGNQLLGSSNKDPKIQYTNNGKILPSTTYSGKIEPLKYNIMPLFYIDTDGSEKKIIDYTLDIDSGDASNFSWNIIGKEAGISGLGTETRRGDKKIVNDSGNIIHTSNIRVSDFLSSSDTNYLILFNNSDIDITYTIVSSKQFTKPISEIISSATVGKYKQNIKTTINYADIVNKSKYSIYSGN